MTTRTSDLVSLECVGTLPDGTIFDTSRRDVAEAEDLAEAQPDHNYESLAVEVGAGTVIEGLDGALVGMSVGDKKGIEISPEKVCGGYDENLAREHETEQPREVPGDEPEEGLYVQAQQGGLDEIIHTDDDVVRIDPNHELADETLTFGIEILDTN